MNKVLLGAIVSVCSLALCSCATHQPVRSQNPVCVNDPAFRKKWDDVKIIRDHPIVDVHTHMFNSRYLPLKHVVKARMWVKGPAVVGTLLANGLGLMDAATTVLATSTPETEEEAKTRMVKVRQYLAKRGERETDDAAMFHAMTQRANRPRKPELFLAFQSSSSGTPDQIGPLAYLAYETIWNEFLVSFVASWFVHDQSTGGKGAFGIAPFGVSMMSSEEELQKRVERLFPSVDLFVYQNMDLVPSFYAGKTYTYAYGREYPEKGKVGAAPRIRQMRKASNGRIISFVAWNPFRTQNSTGISSLDLIKREISKGASGVKFYPPLGYRPAGNDFTQYQKPFFFSEARDQWENRYLGNKANQKGKQEADMLKERAKEVDRLNDELFTWCEKKDIPVFTHCSTGEFRAFYTDEYAENANPKYWEFVLMKHPKLRLCFGHAGGVTDWYSGCVAPIGNVKSAKNWGEAVRYFCMKYPNVYCEFGCHDDVAKPEQAEHLYYNLLTYLPQKEPGPWSLADKVMYGSDFSMPIATPAQDYLESFERLFSLPGMRQYKARFFAGNAMKYLKRKVSDRYP